MRGGAGRLVNGVRVGEAPRPDCAIPDDGCPRVVPHPSALLVSVVGAGGLDELREGQPSAKGFGVLLGLEQTAPDRFVAGVEFEHESDSPRRFGVDMRQASPLVPGLGMALRAAGVVEQGARGIALLQEAAAVLKVSSCRLEHANALVELGAALRRTSQRAQAREHLRAGLDLAYRCGAAPPHRARAAQARRNRREATAARADRS